MQNEGKPVIQSTERFTPWQRILLTVVACSATTLLATPLLGHLDLANIVMLFLLTVLLIAVSLGRGAAVLAAVLSVLLFDIFFVPPRFSLAVSNIQYLVTFAVMLAVALVIGQLAARLREKAVLAARREEEMRALYEELISRLDWIEFADTPRISAANFVSGPKKMPVRYKIN